MAGIKRLENDQRIPYGINGAYSTKENIDEARRRKRLELKKNCDIGKSQAEEILATKFPEFSINCNQYHNFNNLINGRHTIKKTR